MKKNVTMGDIARRLSVSNVTVSKALGGKEGVSSELRERIHVLADEMGYRYNSTAKAMKNGYTCNIGILVAERFLQVNNSFYWSLYQNVLTELLKLNYYGILEVLRDEDEQALTPPKIIQDTKVDGLIIMGQISNEYIELVSRIQEPFMFMDFYEHHHNIDTVLTDNFYGNYLLTDYLIHNGHRNIGFVGNIKATSSIEDRFLGYYKALLEGDIPLNQDCIIPDRDDVGRYIGFALPQKMPTAFVCNCDEVAYRFIRALQASGYAVPDDISVVGFDNFMISDISEPSITTVEVDMKAMAQAAVETIIKKIKNINYVSGRQLISGKIVIKDSVKKIG
ncbi:MAG: LacI family DNA-binding transcriptional regulator [Acetanaerobacterium sp.]